MTLEDLLRTFQSARGRGNATREQSDLKGIRAVVTALRDEICAGYAENSARDLANQFNEILASDGDGKAAGGSTRKTEHGDGTTGATSAVAATTPAAASKEVITGEVGREFGAPAAAPDVCVWTPGGEHGGFQPSCTDIWTFSPYVALPNKCPGCKRPISIKSEAAR